MSVNHTKRLTRIVNFAAAQKRVHRRWTAAKSTTGFTLIETLVAIAILVVAIAGPLTLATQSLSASLSARDEVLAFHLAQEALEYVRNKRDENMLEDAGDPWLRSPIDRCTDVDGCTVDVLKNKIKKCTGDCPVLRFDSNANSYGYQMGAGTHATLFRRTVNVTEPIPDEEALITVTMEWKSGSRDRQIILEEKLRNWQQGIGTD